VFSKENNCFQRKTIVFKGKLGSTHACFASSIVKLGPCTKTAHFCKRMLIPLSCKIKREKTERDKQIRENYQPPPARVRSRAAPPSPWPPPSLPPPPCYLFRLRGLSPETQVTLVVLLSSVELKIYSVLRLHQLAKFSPFLFPNNYVRLLCS
jgi:hypothetical protein